MRTRRYWNPRYWATRFFQIRPIAAIIERLYPFAPLAYAKRALHYTAELAESKTARIASALRQVGEGRLYRTIRATSYGAETGLIYSASKVRRSTAEDPATRGTTGISKYGV